MYLLLGNYRMDAGPLGPSPNILGIFSPDLCPLGNRPHPFEIRCPLRPRPLGIHRPLGYRPLRDRPSGLRSTVGLRSPRNRPTKHHPHSLAIGPPLLTGPMRLSPPRRRPHLFEMRCSPGFDVLLCFVLQGFVL